MITSETILATTTHGVPSGNYDGSSQDWFSDAVQAADYWKGRGTSQTVFFRVTDFEGTIKIAATLDTLPDTADWFYIYTYSNGLSPLTDYHPVTLPGNFVWLRAEVLGFDGGVIESVTVSY